MLLDTALLCNSLGFSLGGCFEASWGALWDLLGTLWGAWKGSRAVLGGSWRPLGELFGTSWALEGLLGPLGSHLEASWDSLGILAEKSAILDLISEWVIKLFGATKSD